MEAYAHFRLDRQFRGDAGAKGRRARRVPIVMKLGAEIKRYVARFRPGLPFSLITSSRLRG
jgi:hypothetical protein